MKQVLIVEDCLEVARLISDSLSCDNIQTTVAGTFEEAILAVKSHEFDLAVLDLNLPDGNGLELMLKLRQEQTLSNIPIFFLSANEELNVKLSAFSLGAEDYIVKPFSTIELRARVDAKLRKAEHQKSRANSIFAWPLHLDLEKQKLSIEGESAGFSLTPIEFRILALLAKHREVIYSREQIMDVVWGSDIYLTDRTIDTHIYTLRKKLGRYANLVQAIPGEGYRLAKRELA